MPDPKAANSKNKLKIHTNGKVRMSLMIDPDLYLLFCNEADSSRRQRGCHLEQVFSDRYHGLNNPAK